MEFIGKCVVVTGAGMGIGEAIALKFAEQGADIVILDINLDLAKKVQKKIEEKGRNALAIETDVSDRKNVESSFEQIASNVGKVDVLVNNAGITQPAEDIVDLDPEVWDKVLDVDYRGVYNCTRSAGKMMIKQGAGAVVNIASAAGLISLPVVSYGPAKAAVIHFTKIVARGWIRKGIRVNAIAPGWVLTPLIQEMLDSGMRDRESLLKAVPMKEFIMPEDIAEATLFLCSEKSRFITGITLPVDAGACAEGLWSAFGL